MQTSICVSATVTVYVSSEQHLDCQDIIGWHYSEKGASVAFSHNPLVQIGDVLFSINDIVVCEKKETFIMDSWRLFQFGASIKLRLGRGASVQLPATSCRPQFSGFGSILVPTLSGLFPRRGVRNSSQPVGEDSHFDFTD